MNVQANMSGGQRSGKVSDQRTTTTTNTQNNLASAGIGGPSRNNMGPVENETVKHRHFMQNLVFNMLQQRQPCPVDPASKAKYMDVARRLEIGLFKMAISKEDYLNKLTLESRIASLIKDNHQRLANNASSVGTMVPTPGLSRPGGNPNLTVTPSPDATTIVGKNSATGTGVNAGNLVPPGGMHGNQHSLRNLTLGSGRNMGSQSTGQMIPTPGFNNSGTNNNSGGFSAQPTEVPQSQQQQLQQQKQNIGGQNSLMLSNQMTAGPRPNVQPKPDVAAISSVNNCVVVNDKSVDTTKTLQQSTDNIQRLGKPGEGSTTNPESLHGVVTSAETKTIAQNTNIASLQSMSRANSFLSQQQQKPNQIQQQQQKFLQQRKPNEQTLRQHKPTSNVSLGEAQLASDMVTNVKHEPPGIENHSQAMDSQAYESLQLAQFQNQYQNAGEDSANAERLKVTSQSDICTSHPQNNRQSNENTKISNVVSNEEHIQEDFRQRIIGVDEAQPNNLTEGSVIGENHISTISKSHNLQNPIGTTCKYGKGNNDSTLWQRQRWLMFLVHAQNCKPPPGGKCSDRNCGTVQQLLSHLNSCAEPKCLHPRCLHSKKLITHYKICKNLRCPLCVPVKEMYQRQAKARVLDRLKSETGMVSSVNKTVVSSDSLRNAAGEVLGTPRRADTSDDLQPSSKRLKVEQPLQHVIPKTEESCKTPIVSKKETELSQDAERKDHMHIDGHEPVKLETLEVKKEILDIPVLVEIDIKEEKHEGSENVPKPMPVSELGKYDLSGVLPKQENIKMEKEPDQPKKEDMVVESSGHASESGKPKIKGVSLTELFTPEQVREHIRGLRQWVGQSKAKAEKNQAMEKSMTENCCQLCAVEKLAFEPPPLYCTPCGVRIKRNAMYHTVGGVTRHYFCIPCYNESRGDTILAEGTKILKATLEKKKNDEETEEWWVQCDKCELWQHQICALFNGRRNDGGQAEYTCPNCYITEVEQNERKPLPQSAVLGAKDLPRTILSDHIEQRLVKRLHQERTERAIVQAKSYDEIPTAESLVVRVVSSVDKKLEVKPRFLEISKEENFPTEFPYKSKVVLLFQKIEGVEVCLYGMYVQEYGSECSLPNQRRVYLSYLDSVKYFRADIKTANGEALRTFVYQEILIGYLEYCKLRGFTSCYIWACPPLKGEDYILYCHPEIQKTPKSDKLREWYLAMLRKAAKEGIVVGTTNLYDHFFLQAGECKAKVTSTRLPYFDGDYWPGAAEDLINQMSQEDDGNKKGNKKETVKKTISKRALKAIGQSDQSVNTSKDLLLMHKLGETIHPMKEDFIMVHLQHCCTHCCTLMVTGKRWVCNQCKDFQLCDGCYEAEQKREDRERHPVNHKDKHNLYPVEITDVAADTNDKDEILESEFFDTRIAFLSLCQGNHYQYDTLRRAKHSSMMVLYHLHNPTAPAFVTTCNACHLDIESGKGWRCEVCPDYDVCNTCYSKEGSTNHPHKLTNHPLSADENAQNKEARQRRVVQLRKMLDLLVHATICRFANCQYPNCLKVKGLFRHAITCKTRVIGGCVLCKKVWYLLQLHARDCKASECDVPRCGDLKEHMRRLQQQSDSRRRVAVMEMMRQRAAEIAGTSG